MDANISDCSYIGYNIMGIIVGCSHDAKHGWPTLSQRWSYRSHGQAEHYFWKKWDNHTMSLESGVNVYIMYNVWIISHYDRVGYHRAKCETELNV